MQALTYTPTLPKYVAAKRRAARHGRARAGGDPPAARARPGLAAGPPDADRHLRLRPRAALRQGLAAPRDADVARRSSPATRSWARSAPARAAASASSSSPRSAAAPRGLTPCPECAQGLPALCRNTTDGDVSAGLQTGFCRDTGGGWSEGLVAHASQLHTVPDDLSDEDAVLVEPLACALHAARDRRRPAGRPRRDHRRGHDRPAHARRGARGRAERDADRRRQALRPADRRAPLRRRRRLRARSHLHRGRADHAIRAGWSAIRAARCCLAASTVYLTAWGAERASSRPPRSPGRAVA